MSVAVPALLPSHLDAGHGFEPPAGGFEELHGSATGGSDPFSRLLVFARSLLERRRKEKEAALSECAICLEEVAGADRELTSVTQACKRAYQRVSALYAQPKPSQGPLAETGDPAIYGEIVATIEESEAKTWAEVAMAIVEESCARKASVERKYERCLLQQRMHDAELKKVENACAAAERAVSALSARCHM
ncbi:hypothetical protein BJ138DRAFT_1128032 [Hygrophoropsis aurantiaca]|uniref:Uncharacterized protein n=1 Tax=Hygrophoropsis aurantiaca TaxID=72124 RepID=A0ACB8A627_9AGAM|nr:hypothetical protein BJ138DRAFT_1128032 [Hygrophoropsis aurantiaca]